MSRLTRKDVIEIRDLLECGVPQTRLAAKYGVAQQQISRIKTGQRWACEIKAPEASEGA